MPVNTKSIGRKALMRADADDSKLFIWASDIGENTIEQARKVASMPFVYPHLALMPDAHLGKGATVGSVIPTLGAVIPAAVGVDIGCGMRAVRTQFKVDDLPVDRAWVREKIESLIPLSAGAYNEGVYGSAVKRTGDLEELAKTGNGAKPFDPATYARNWKNQLGSLGSGNHFIEISADENDDVWLFLHSGSRGVGNKLAKWHIGVAQGLMDKWWIQLPGGDDDLAYLVENTPEFDQYMAELDWAQKFAAENRDEMMDRVIEAFEEWTGEHVNRLDDVNCHHNYTSREKHFGKDLIVSRKGAIDAHVGRLGLIPGSMGTASYVVKGKGSKMGLCSAPHGAGRDYSRSQARKTFTFDQLKSRMHGIEWRQTNAFIDEIPDAYKDIDQVMRDSEDLVEIVHELHQLVNVKGD